MSFFIDGDYAAGGPAYVVTYARRPDTGEAYVYLPGRGEEWFALNTRSIIRHVEGQWFRPTAAWERAVAPLLADEPSSASR